MLFGAGLNLQQAAKKKAQPTPSERMVDPDKPMVALTFDDGPSTSTPKILDLLEKYDARATFCVVGNRVARYQKTVKRACEMGCQVIGHSWDHKSLAKLSETRIKRQLQDTNDAIFKATGVQPTMYRPPYGNMSDRLRTVSRQLGLSMILWSVDTEDWRTRSAERTYEAILDSVQDGSIILCHDLYASTVQAMERVIPELQSRGYQLVTVSELLDASGRAVTAGGAYYHK
jgi:peptidoglycan/xylan/chitin deacetylase (PgdA/CDA1 family)